MRDLPKHDVKGGTQFEKNKLYACFFYFSIQQDCLLYDTDCAFRCLYYYIGVLRFLKFGYGPKANILVVLLITTNIMQVVNFFLLDLLSYSLLIVTRNK